MKNLSSQTDLILKIIISVAIVLITIAAYISFGFFFDVFAEAIPILLLPIISVPFIFLSKKFSQIGAIVSAVILIILSIAASIAVGVIATSMPAFGISPKSGKSVNPPSNSIQFDTYEKIKNERWTNVNSYFWIPNGANHADTETIGIDGAFKPLLGIPFEHQTTL